MNLAQWVTLLGVLSNPSYKGIFVRLFAVSFCAWVWWQGKLGYTYLECTTGLFGCVL